MPVRIKDLKRAECSTKFRYSKNRLLGFISYIDRLKQVVQKYVINVVDDKIHGKSWIWSSTRARGGCGDAGVGEDP